MSGPVRDLGLFARSLVALVDSLIDANPGKAEAYRGGRDALLGFFVGGVMRQAAGRADPQEVQRIVRERLAG